MNKLIIVGFESQFGSQVAQKILKKLGKRGLFFISASKRITSKLIDKHLFAECVDLTNSDHFARVLNDGDTLLLISVSRDNQNKRLFHKNIIDGAVKGGVSKIIYTSMVGAGSPCTYSNEVAEHKFTEIYIKMTGIKYIILRNSQFQEYMISAFEQAALSGGVLKSNMGRGSMAYVAQDDCAEAAACVAAGVGKSNSVYNITGPTAYSMEKFCALGSEITEQKVTYRHVDDDTMMRFFEMKNIPRKTDGDWSRAEDVFHSCGDDLVALGKSIRLGEMNICTNDFEHITGRKSKSVTELFYELKNKQCNVLTA